MNPQGKFSSTLLVQYLLNICSIPYSTYCFTNGRNPFQYQWSKSIRASSFPEMINIWEIRSRCLEKCSSCSAPGDGWQNYPQPCTQDPKLLLLRVKAQLHHRGTGQREEPQPQWEDSCTGEANAHSKDSSGLRKAALHLLLGFSFAAKEKNSGIPNTIRRTTGQWPSEQAMSGRQTGMKGQRNSKAALWSYW